MNKYILILALLVGSFCYQYDGYNQNDTFNWGLYKPQLIHAISQSVKNPLTIEQMYFQNKEAYKTLRHKFPKRQSDSIIYNYRINTGVGNYAVQDIFDPLLNNLEMTQDFIRLDSTDWIDTTRNIVTKSQENNDMEIGFIYSIAFQQFDKDSTLTKGRSLQVEKVGENQITIKSSDNKHKFVIMGKNISEKISYRGLAKEQSSNWEIEDHLFWIGYNFNNKVEDNSTVIFVKTAVKMNNDAEIQVHYTPNIDSNIQYFDDSQITPSLNKYFQQLFERAFNVKSGSESFSIDSKFQTIRKLLQKQNNGQSEMKKTPYNTLISDREMSCAVQSFSNLMGAIQYSYGTLHCLQNEPTCPEYLPHFTTTPSRFGFPRPFLWDDGFHQMLSCQWDIEFCKQSINKWFNTQSPKDGWIPREQPRGDELRNYYKFLLENNQDANPPSFLYNLLHIQSLGGDNKEFIDGLLPKIELWFEWWMNMQRVKEPEGSDIVLFEWWGYTQKKLGSGMDDWPRIDKIDGLEYKSKYNVDASSWAYLFSETLYKLTNNSTYAETAQSIKNSINKVLFNADDSIYYDYMEHKRLFQSSLFHLSTHLGYPNFLPLIVGIVDDVSVVEKQIQAMMNEDTLWTIYGIRSLNVQDHYFGKQDNYWRGPIWINIQYLLLRSMKLFYWESTPLAQTFYDKLRANVINTVCGQFEERGYFFEHFNQHQDGQGAGQHPFNGWTSLIILIITESYV